MLCMWSMGDRNQNMQMNNQVFSDLTPTFCQLKTMNSKNKKLYLFTNKRQKCFTLKKHPISNDKRKQLKIMKNSEIQHISLHNYLHCINIFTSIPCVLIVHQKQFGNKCLISNTSTNLKKKASHTGLTPHFYKKKRGGAKKFVMIMPCNMIQIFFPTQNRGLQNFIL